MKIIKDTREKPGHGWQFKDMIVAKLYPGDYSIQGKETIVCVERKQSIAEFASWMVTPRCQKSLEAMQSIAHKFIIIEDIFDHVIKYPNIPSVPFKIRDQIKISPFFILKNIAEFQIHYGVHIIFAGNARNANDYAISIFKRIEENNE